jgi:hypothetical protein
MQSKIEHRTQMMKLIPDWQASGVKQKEYCRTNKIAYHVFHYWYGVYRSNKADTGSFLPVKIKATPAANTPQQITILGTSGIQVQVPFTEQSIGFVKQLLLS